MAEHTNFSKEKVQTSSSNLQSVAPQDSELNNTFTQTVTELESINAQHDNFLNKYIQEISPLGSIYEGYNTMNQEFLNFIDNLNAAVTEFSNADSNGGVKNPGSGGSIEPQTTNIGEIGTGTFKTPDGKKLDIPTPTAVPDIPPSKIDPGLKDRINLESSDIQNREVQSNTSDIGNTGTTQTIGTIGSSFGGGSTGKVVGGIAGVGTGLIGAGAVGAGKIDSSQTTQLRSNNSFGNYEPSKDTFSKLPQDVQEKVVDKLKQLGFSDSEIEAIKNGETAVPKLAIDAVSEQLEATLKSNPQLRDEIIKKYGLDPFNEDGTINKDKLAIALLMDDKTGKDDYSLITMLHNEYGVDIVDQSLYTTLSNKLETALSKDANLRSKLMDKYGFDVFNEDGTINRDKLSLAMLMDEQNTTDDYDLSKYLNANYKEDQLKNVASSIANPLSNGNKSGIGVAPILAGVGLAGAAGSGIAVAKHNKDKKEKEEDDEELKDISTSTPIQKENEDKQGYAKDWLSGLGVGLDDDKIEEKKTLI